MITTSQQITKFYEQYRDTEIIFTKEIVTTLKLDPRQVYLKCPGAQWSCIINSASFLAAKIIVGTKGGAYAAVTQESPNVSLRFCFTQADNQLLSFFVNARVGEIKPYGAESQELALITLNYTQRPPDDLIEVMGRLLETTANAQRYKDNFIAVSEETKRYLNVTREDTVVFIQNVPRHCILREISFSGAKVMMQGIAQFLKNKEVALKIDFEEPRETMNIKGAICDIQEIQGRKDIVLAQILFDEKAIPMQYKLHLNGYVTSIQAKRTQAQNS